MSTTHAVSSPGAIQTSSGEVVNLKISNIKYAIGVTPKRKRKYCVQIATEDFSKKTKRLHPSEGNSVLWSEVFSILGTTGTVLTYKVFRTSRIVGYDTLVAEGQWEIGILTQEDVTLNLTTTKSNERSLLPASTIGFKITSNNADLVKEVDRLVIQIHTSNHWRPDTAIDADTSGVGGDSDQIGEILQSLLRHVQIFTTNTKTVSEVPLYAELAWSVLTAALKAIKQQEQVDESVVNLAQQMNNMYELVNRADPLKKVQGNEGQMKVLVAMTQQTLECAYFIRDYCTDTRLLKRAFKHPGPSAQKLIADYSRILSNLRSAFMDQSAVNTQISVTRIMDIVDDIAPPIEAVINLNDIPYAASAGFDLEKKCLEGTRVKIIEEICLWASGTKNGWKNVFLLTGFAGAGKSTIAHSVAHRFRALNRLGSMFCFDRANPEDRHPDNIFRTIARDLADLDAEWRQLLYPHIQTREARTTNSPEFQFLNFILAPSQGLKRSENLLAVGPVVIIIDALDESTERVDRGVLLDILSTQTVHLPMNFRIFITSRAEQDIEAAFRDKWHVHHLRMRDIESIDKDVEVFVRDELHYLSGDPGFNMDDAVGWLTKNAEGLFQWANMACQFIAGAKPADQLEKLKLAVSRKEAWTELGALDKLYDSILSQTFNFEEKGVRERFTTVMGWIIAAREPLSKSSLRGLGRLSGADPNGNAVDDIIPSLGSLLSGVHDEDFAIIPLHTSFRDFLQTHYCQKIHQHHEELATWALQIMMDNLRFNISNLESSYVPGTAVEILHEHRDSTRITLSYACRFWAYHVSRSSSVDLASKASVQTNKVLNILSDLMREAKAHQ